MQKRYWLQGGLLALLLFGLLILILYYFGDPKECDFICFPYWALPLVYIGVIFNNILDFFSISENSLYSYFAFGVIFNFSLGAIAGFIYGKFKKTK